MKKENGCSSHRLKAVGFCNRINFMKGTNHLKYGIELAVLGSILLYPSDIKNTAIFSTACIISSVLPDIDTPESLVGKKSKTN